MLATADDALEILGSTIRAVRRARGLTQQRTAKAAKVSRTQLALLESGENVSVKLLLRIAHALELRDIPLDGKVRLTLDADGLNVHQLLESVEVLSAVVDQLRLFAVSAILPPTERAKLTDAPALREVLARHTGDADGILRLGEALLQLAREAPSQEPPKDVRHAESTQRERRTRRRAG